MYNLKRDIIGMRKIANYIEEFYDTICNDEIIEKDRFKKFADICGLSDVKIEHSYGVYTNAYESGHNVIIVLGSLLHDIGYGENVADMHSHFYDGYNFLKDTNLYNNNMLSHEILLPVLLHSNALGYAKFNNRIVFEDMLNIINSYEKYYLDSAMAYVNLVSSCDLTTLPDGSKCSMDERINNIIERYGRDSLEHRTVVDAVNNLKELIY